MKTKQEITDTIIKLIITEQFGTADAANENANFKYDLDFDSLDCVEFLMMVEDELGIAITDGEAESFYDKTVGEFAAFLYSKQ